MGDCSGNYADPRQSQADPPGSRLPMPGSWRRPTAHRHLRPGSRAISASAAKPGSQPGQCLARAIPRVASTCLRQEKLQCRKELQGTSGHGAHPRQLKPWLTRAGDQTGFERPSPPGMTRLRWSDTWWSPFAQYRPPPVAARTVASTAPAAGRSSTCGRGPPGQAD